VLQFAIIFVVLVAVVVVLTAPLRRGTADAPAAEQRTQTAREIELAELEAAREAKYREIRDADLDHRTGKLSDEDYEQLDAGLRAEAIEILAALDRVQSPASIGQR
jgi:hypothetical protein